MPITWENSYTLEDEEGKKSVVSLHLPGGTLQADAVGFAEDMAELIDNLTGAKITRIALCLIVDLPVGLKASALAESEVEIGARFGFADANAFRTSVRIPSFLLAKLVAGSNAVDQTDADVIAFVNAMEDGLTPIATLVEPSTNRGDDIVDLTTAIEAFTKTRR